MFYGFCSHSSTDNPPPPPHAYECSVDSIHVLSVYIDEKIEAMQSSHRLPVVRGGFQHLKVETERNFWKGDGVARNF